MTEVTVDTESIGRKAGRGLGWGLLGNAVGKVGSFATALVLARLLVPHDFGVYAVALAATQFVLHINDVGLIAATIQWRGRLEDMAPTAATLAATFSVLIYVGFWFAAPAFAELAGIPEATPVIRLFTVTILIDGFTAVRNAYLLRTFRQDQVIKANMAGIVANAAVAIGLAAAGAGAVGLAAGQVASSVTTGVLTFVWAGLPVRAGLDLAITRRLMAYGVPLAASLGVEAVLIQADKVIVGRLMGATALGFYLLAYSVSSWAPGLIGSALRYVTIPSFSRLSEGDTETLSRGVRRWTTLLVTGLIPIAVLVIALAEPMISFLYGERWLPAAPVLRFMMIFMVVRMLTAMGMDVLMGAGATRWTLLINIGWAAAVVPALWMGTTLGGGRGAAIAHAMVGVLVAVPLAVLALRRVGVHLTPIGPALVRPALAGALAGAVAVFLRLVSGPNTFIQLAVAGTGGLLAYLATAVPRRQLRDWIVAARAGRRAPIPAPRQPADPARSAGRPARRAGEAGPPAAGPAPPDAPGHTPANTTRRDRDQLGR
jgi:O-antigen/teichoic acid export membrane protein